MNFGLNNVQTKSTKLRILSSLKKLLQYSWLVKKNKEKERKQRKVCGTSTNLLDRQDGK